MAPEVNRQRSTWLVVIRDAILVALLSAVLALLFNTARPSGGIELVAKEEYEVLVPCPEHQGRASTALEPAQVDHQEKGLLLVDAREREDFARWHLPGAISIPYDYLEPNPEEKKILRTMARKVIVYGDGDDPDSGRQLADAISGKGVKNVFHVRGGADALKNRAQRREP